ARSRGMRSADQGLWRYVEARQRQLPAGRDAHHRPGPGRTHAARARPGRHRERARRGACRSRGRGAHALPCRDGGARRAEHRRRVAQQVFDGLGPFYSLIATALMLIIYAVMAGLVPAIHVFVGSRKKTWMPGTRSGMTNERTRRTADADRCVYA